MIDDLEPSPEDWGEFAAFLIKAESEPGLRQGAGSYSEWIKRLAAKHGKSEGVIWRALAAGRIYTELRVELAKKGHSFPVLRHAAADVSPDGLELLGKITRVAPAAVVEPLKQRVMNGQVTRKELRELWQTYRGVLGGRTARGRNVPAPKYDARDVEQYHSRLEAECITALRDAGPSWCGGYKDAKYRIFLHPDLRAIAGVSPEAVAVVGPSAKQRLLLHGIEVAHDVREWRELLDPQRRFVDFHWLVFSSAPDAAERQLVPREVGIVIIEHGRVHVARAAVINDRPDSMAVDTLRELLSLAL